MLQVRTGGAGVAGGGVTGTEWSTGPSASFRRLIDPVSSGNTGQSFNEIVPVMDLCFYDKTVIFPLNQVTLFMIAWVSLDFVSHSTSEI